MVLPRPQIERARGRLAWSGTQTRLWGLASHCSDGMSQGTSHRCCGWAGWATGEGSFCPPLQRLLRRGVRGVLVYRTGLGGRSVHPWRPILQGLKSRADGAGLGEGASLQLSD